MVTVTSFTCKDIHLIFNNSASLVRILSHIMFFFIFSSFAHSSISSQFFCLCVVYSYFFFLYHIFWKNGNEPLTLSFFCCFILFFYILDGGKKFIIVVAFLRSRKIQYFYISFLFFLCTVFSLFFPRIEFYVFYVVYGEKQNTETTTTTEILKKKKRIYVGRYKLYMNSFFAPKLHVRSTSEKVQRI